MKRLIDVVCPECGREQIDVWAETVALPRCECSGQTERLWRAGSTATVVGDDIPGGVLIHNAICNDDGTPKRYYSHSSMRKAAKEKGWVNHVERGAADKTDYDRLTRRV